MEVTVSEIAARVEGKLDGDGARVIHRVAGIRSAGEGDLTFIANARYAPEVADTKASAVVVPRDWDKPCGAPAMIRVDDPDKAFAQAAEFFAPPVVKIASGVHPMAVVADDASVADDVSIGPFCVVEAGVSIGAGTVIFAGCYIGQNVSVGENCKLYPGVSIRENCRIGNRNVFHNGAVIGSDGFGYTVDEKGVRHKIPQIGIVVIGDDVEVGANTTIDRARFGETQIGNGVKIDNLVQIAHNCIIGDHSVVVAQTGIAGSATIGKYVILAGQSAVTGHVKVGDGVVLTGQSGISKDTPPKAIMRGSPAVPMNQMMKEVALVRRLPKMKKTVDDLLKRVADLEDKTK